jgi:hypothetical protein
MNSAKEKPPKQTAMGKLLLLICGKKKVSSETIYQNDF